MSGWGTWEMAAVVWQDPESGRTRKLQVTTPCDASPDLVRRVLLSDLGGGGQPRARELYVTVRCDSGDLGTSEEFEPAQSAGEAA